MAALCQPRSDEKEKRWRNESEKEEDFEGVEGRLHLEIHELVDALDFADLVVGEAEIGDIH